MDIKPSAPILQHSKLALALSKPEVPLVGGELMLVLVAGGK
jgi:hypothetical protein